MYICSSILGVIFAALVFLTPVAVDASATTMIAGGQASDTESGSCGTNRLGAQRFTPNTASAGWSPWVEDLGGSDISCIRIYHDPGPSSKDVRLCVRVENNGTISSEACTPWASDMTSGSGEWSSWAQDKDNDAIQFRVENRAMPAGSTLTSTRLGIQLSKRGTGDACTQVGTARYTTTGTGWSSWAVDGGNGGVGGDFDCARVFLEGTTGSSAVYPSVNLSVNDSSITSGESVTLSWSSTNASYCQAYAGTGFSTGNRTSGSDSAAPTSSQSYSIRCYSSTGHTSTDSVYVTVSAAAAVPTATLSASSNSVTSGGTVTLSWSSANATSCSGTGSGFSVSGTSGSDTVNPTVDTTYTLTCTGAGGSASDSETVTVITTSPPVVDLTADDAVVPSGESTQVRWTVSGANSCSEQGVGFDTGGAFTGSDWVTPSSPSTTYTLRCSNAYGMTEDSVTVSVNQVGMPDLVAATPTVYPSSGIEPGDAVQFRSTISNEGEVDAEYYYTLFYIDVGNDGTDDATRRVYNDGTIAGVSESVATADTLLAGGIYAVRACADSYSEEGDDFRDNRITESDESNNCSAPFVFVTEAPDLVAAAPTLSTGSPQTGDSVTFTSIVSNQGDHGFSPSFYNLFQLDLGNDGDYDWTYDRFTGEIGEGDSSSVVSGSWTASVGTHSVRLCADTHSSNVTYQDFIRESDESNNCSTATSFTVTDPTPTATLQVSTPDTSPTGGPINISDGEQITLSWSSTNATSCSGSNFATGDATSGTQASVTEPTAGNSTTYTLACTGTGGVGSYSLTVTGEMPNPPILSSTDEGEPVVYGTDSTFTYNVNGNNLASCSFAGPDVPGSVTTPTGTFDVTIQGETNVTLTCTGGSDTATVRVVPQVYEQ